MKIVGMRPDRELNMGLHYNSDKLAKKQHQLQLINRKKI